MKYVHTALIFVLMFMVGCSSSSTNESASNPPERSPLSAETANQQPTSSRFPEAIQKILEAGKNEGNVTYFGITTDPGAVQKFEGALEAFYGFPIKVNMISGLHPQKAAEIISAAKSGVKSDIDVFHSAANTMVMLDKANLFADVNWTSDFELDDSFGMLGGKVLRLTDRFLANVVYNTDLVSEEEAPKSYDDVLDPKWRGKIIMPRTPSPFTYMAGTLGEEYTDKFVNALSNQDIAITAQFPDVNARVGAGEYAIGIGIEAERDSRRGAPMANAPIEPVIITPWGNAIMKDAAHPNAGKLMTYYLSTPEGQRLMDELWSVSLSTIEGTASYRHVEGKEIIIIEDEFIINKFEGLVGKYADMMGMR